MAVGILFGGLMAPTVARNLIEPNLPWDLPDEASGVGVVLGADRPRERGWRVGLERRVGRHSGPLPVDARALTDRLVAVRMVRRQYRPRRAVQPGAIGLRGRHRTSSTTCAASRAPRAGSVRRTSGPRRTRRSTRPTTVPGVHVGRHGRQHGDVHPRPRPDSVPAHPGRTRLHRRLLPWQPGRRRLRERLHRRARSGIEQRRPRLVHAGRLCDAGGLQGHALVECRTLLARFLDEAATDVTAGRRQVRSVGETGTATHAAHLELSGSLPGGD